MANHDARKLASRRAKFNPDWAQLNTYFSACGPVCREWRRCPRCQSGARKWFDSAASRVTAIYDREELAVSRKILERTRAI